MAVTVRVPTAMRRLSGGAELIRVEGADVRSAIESLRAQHPDLAKQLLDDSGAVRRFVNLFAGDEDIRFLDDLDTALADGDELSIVPAIAGGLGSGT